MAAINFPGSPEVNDTHIENGRTWIWNGTSWASITNTGYTGSSGSISKSVTIIAPETSDDVSLFYTTTALTISKVKAVLTGSSSPSITYSVKSGSDRSAVSETHVNEQTVTSTTSGTEATVADSSIASNTWVWLSISAVSGTVDTFSITLEF